MMNDLISRQAAIDVINELHVKPNAWLDLAVEALEKLPSSQPKQRWIPCSERLQEMQEKGLRVLMYLNNAWQLVGWYDKEDKQWYALPFSQEVVNDCVLAWMPLPEDYEEDKQ